MAGSGGGGGDFAGAEVWQAAVVRRSTRATRNLKRGSKTAVTGYRRATLSHRITPVNDESTWGGLTTNMDEGGVSPWLNPAL